MTSSHLARPRSSRAVRLGALGALSLALAACSSPASQSVSGPPADYTGPSGGYAVDDGTAPSGGDPVPPPAQLADDGSTAHCVLDGDDDGSYEIVDDDLCDDDDGYRNSHAGSYYWYYGGYPSGRRITGGTTIKPPGVRPPSGTALKPPAARAPSGTTNGQSGGQSADGVTRGGFGNRSGTVGG